MDFTLKTQHFEGPLDLLLNLIEERKMLISDVSLSQVADAFLGFISNRNGFPVAETAHFIVVASTLLLLKSKSLLPVLALTDEEEGDIHDLEKRLALLSIIRRSAKDLAVHRAQMFFVTGIRDTTPLFAPSKDMSLESIHKAVRNALKEAPSKKIIDEVEVKKIISLDEMIERMTARVQKALTMSFKDFSNGATDPREIVVGFLAMLELVKRGFAQVSQRAQFEDITIEYAGSSETPKYE